MYRIFAHLRELGLLHDNSVILDPLSGTGMTAIIAGMLGLKAITVELEPYFKDLQGECQCQGVTVALFKRMMRGDSRTRRLSYINTRICPACQIEVDKRRAKKGVRTIFTSEAHFYGGNKEFIGRKLGREVDWTILQGDARELSKLLSDKGVDKPTALDPNTYLGSMAQVYSEIAKVSDVICTITKNPTRNNALRLLDEDTKALLEAAGYTIVCHHKAILFTEHTSVDLFGETQKKVKGRLSFFKRDAYNKGRVVAQWEDILIGVKGESRDVISVLSPPYEDALDSGSRHQHKDKALERLGGYNVGVSSPGQIGNLKDKPITIVSPPYADQETPLNKQGKGSNHDTNRGNTAGRHYLGMQSPGQIGNLKDR